MTVLRYNNKANGQPAFNNLLSDLFPQMPSLYNNDYKSAVPVNIRESKNEYFLDLFAPGLNKEDFKIVLENNILSVSVEKKEEKATDNEKMIRREFTQQAFKRSFTLDEKINAEGISAEYVNGILVLNLPKKEEVKPATKQIKIQ